MLVARLCVYMLHISKGVRSVTRPNKYIFENQRTWLRLKKVWFGWISNLSEINHLQVRVLLHLITTYKFQKLDTRSVLTFSQMMGAGGQTDPSADNQLNPITCKHINFLQMSHIVTWDVILSERSVRGLTVV